MSPGEGGGGRWEVALRDPSDQGACGVSPAASMSVKDHRGEADVAPLASVGCVMGHPFQVFVLSKVLGRGRRRVWIPCSRAEAGSNRKNPQLSEIMFFPWGIQTSRLA